MRNFLVSLVFLFSIPAFSQKIIKDHTDQIEGYRFVTTSTISIDSKYSKPPVSVDGMLVFPPISLTPSFSLYFTFPVKSPIFFEESNYAIIVLETGERLKPKYNGRVKTAGWKNNKMEYFGIDLWDSDVEAMSKLKVSAIRIVTDERNFDFDLTETEAKSLIKLIQLMKSIK